MNHRLSLLSSAFVVALALSASSALADAPTLLPVQGYLADTAGAPLDGSFNIRFRLYASSLGGTPLFEETPSVLVDNGYFTVYLGDTQPLPLTIFSQNSAVFMGVRVGNDAESAPFIELATAPYAAFAQYCAAATTATSADSATTATTAGYATTAGDAATLGGATSATLREWAGLTGVPASFPPDAHTHVVGEVAGAQPLVTGSCSTGSSINQINADGTVSCEVDDNTTYTVSTGLTLLGNTIGLDQSTVQSWCYDTEAELTGVLNDNYAALAHTHAANTLTGSFNAITSTGTVTATGFNYTTARSTLLWVPAEEFESSEAYTANSIKFVAGYPPALAFDSAQGTAQSLDITTTLQLPLGATITGFTCFFTDLDTGLDWANLTGTLHQVQYNPFLPGYQKTALFQGIGFSPSTGYSAGARLSFASDVASAPVVVSGGNIYMMQVNSFQAGSNPLPVSGLRFYGCNIAYTKPSPD